MLEDKALSRIIEPMNVQATGMKIVVSWVITQYSFVNGYSRLLGTCRFRLQAARWGQ
jgi:hypothetical protein